MTIREEFLELLRQDPDFRDQVRRHLLSEELLALPGHFTEAQARTDERLGQLTQHVGQLTQHVGQLAQAQTTLETRMGELTQHVGELAQAQTRTEEHLTDLASRARGEEGRRRGERYEAEVLRRAPALFAGGEGGSTHEYTIRSRVTELLAPLLEEDELPAEEDPFLADVLWWKGDTIALVEASIQVDSGDVERASQRAETIRKSGASVVPVVVGEEWATSGARAIASQMGVEWKVGDDLSEGFIRLRRGRAA